MVFKDYSLQTVSNYKKRNTQIGLRDYLCYSLFYKGLNQECITL